MLSIVFFGYTTSRVLDIGNVHSLIVNDNNIGRFCLPR